MHLLQYIFYRYLTAVTAQVFEALHSSLPLPASIQCESMKIIALVQVMMDFLKEWETKLAIKITCSQVTVAISSVPCLPAT